MEDFELLKLSAICHFVKDISAARSHYVNILGFREIGQSSSCLNTQRVETSVAFLAGECCVICTQPLAPDSVSGRYLARHPEGIGSLLIGVEDLVETAKALEQRGATTLWSPTRFMEAFQQPVLEIATPMDDFVFQFCEASNVLPPGFVQTEESSDCSNTAQIQIKHIDHVTCNYQTMSPALLWLENVLGMSRYWETEFHANGIGHPTGTGLRSVVMANASGKIKFANNEPLAPNFHESQISLYCDQQLGTGVQHVALEVTDIVETVRTLKNRGVQFVETSQAYYRALPGRLTELGIEGISESIEELEELGVLVDGDGPDSYLLQIFMLDMSGGPFFYELIQRKGNSAFGEGNFRVLFEGVARTQKES